MLTILIGTLPSVILRWAILRRPVAVGAAVAICFGILVGVVLLLEAMQLKAGVLPGAVAVCSFGILRWGTEDNPKQPKS